MYKFALCPILCDGNKLISIATFAGGPRDITQDCFIRWQIHGKSVLSVLSMSHPRGAASPLGEGDYFLISIYTIPFAVNPAKRFPRPDAQPASLNIPVTLSPRRRTE